MSLRGALSGVEPDVLALDLDTRAGSAADARERTRAAVRDAGLLYVEPTRGCAAMSAR